jgi:amino acid transporter
MKILVRLLTFVILTHNLTFGQATDSIPSSKQTEQTISNLPADTEELEDVDGFPQGIFVFALFGFVFILMIAGAGIVLTAIGILILLGLIGTGILSASILVGLNKRSFTK